MNNHYHVVLHLDTDATKQLSDLEADTTCYKYCMIM